VTVIFIFGLPVIASSSSQPTRVERHAALGKMSTNNIAELTAIRMALDIVQEQASSGQLSSSQEIHICTDSKYSCGMLVKNWQAKKNQDLIAEIKVRNWFLLFFVCLLGFKTCVIRALMQR